MKNINYQITHNPLESIVGFVDSNINNQIYTTCDQLIFLRYTSKSRHSKLHCIMSTLATLGVEEVPGKTSVMTMN